MFMSTQVSSIVGDRDVFVYFISIYNLEENLWGENGIKGNCFFRNPDL